MNSEWKELKLGDVAHYVTEKIDIKEVNLDNYVSTENLLPNMGGLNLASSLPNVCKVTKFKSNDILISNIRPYFKKIWMADRNGGCSNDVLALEADDIDEDYLYYNLAREHFFNFVMSGAKGTKMPRGDKNHILGYEINIPPIQEQKAIAQILSALDEKIETNNQINKKLDEMAQVIFKHWFVDFEFPNDDGEPYKSSGGEMIESELGLIPKGWEVKEIDALCNHIKPGTNHQPKRVDEGIPFLNVRNINKGYIDVTDVKYISEIDYENVHKSWVPEENDVLISRIGTLGLVAVIRKRDLPIAVHYNFINFKTKDVTFQFLYFALKTDFFQSQYHGIKKASVQEYVTLDEVKKLKFVLPSNKDQFKKFEKIFIDIYELINNKQGETENLTNLRDTLLPKLMSGEIRVPLEDGDIS